MSKHTPGPWEVNRAAEPEESTEFYFTSEKGVIGYWKGGRNRHADDQWLLTEADARLIAAAPELLEALGSLLAAYSEPDQRICCSGFDCGCMGATTYQQAEHYARAAIAKAKGEGA